MARQRHLGQPREFLDVIVIGGSQAGLATKTPPTSSAASPAGPQAVRRNYRR